MEHDFSGWLWLIVTVGFVGALGLALVYGVNRYRQRTAGEKLQQEQATKELYRREDK